VQSVSRLINDLDLTLVAPDGEVHLPWTLDAPLGYEEATGEPNEATAQQAAAADPAETTDPPGWTAADLQPATRAVDRRNNVERVDVCEPIGGIWRVRVTGHKLALGTIQNYSLAASLPFVPCPTPPDEVCEALDEPCEPTEVCTEYPWSCEGASGAAPSASRGAWTLDPDEVLSLRRLCSRGLDCPPCAVRPWEECPAWTVRIGGLPERSRVVVFDETGKIVAVDESGAAVREIPIEGATPDDRRFLLFADAQGRPLREPIRFRATVLTE
jgi:hypothetical protein